MPHTAYLNIGSNIGDRQAQIDLAVVRIEQLCNGIARRSDVIETPAWGFESKSLFLNIGIAIETDLSPEDLLKGLQAIEKSISPASHRDENGNYVDRAIDIDIIAIDDLIIDTPNLIVPHPRMHLRNFVLIPMKQIAPEWKNPRESAKNKG